jgi:hypothetical protein
MIKITIFGERVNMGRMAPWPEGRKGPLQGRGRLRPSRGLHAPINALDRAIVHGLLDGEDGSAPGVNNQGKAQGFVHPEDLGADFLAGTAMDAVGPDDLRGGVGHEKVICFRFA